MGHASPAPTFKGDKKEGVDRGTAGGYLPSLPALPLVSLKMVEMCLDSMAISLGMVMAGSGHLPSFVLFRQLSKRIGGEITCGSHMAVVWNLSSFFFFLFFLLPFFFLLFFLIYYPILSSIY